MSLDLKILLLTGDTDTSSILEGVETNADLIISNDGPEIIEMVEGLKSAEELSIIFLDFDTHRSDSERICSECIETEYLKTIVFTGEVAVSELKKHQRGGQGAHAYLRKPLSLEQLQDIVQTTQVAYYAERGEETPDEEQLCFFSSKTFDQMTSTDLIENNEDSQANFDPKEFKVNTEVRRTLVDHNGDTFDENESVNQKVQNIFDLAFGGSFEKEINAHKTAIHNANPTDGLILPDADDDFEDMRDSGDSEKSTDDESPTIALNLETDSHIEIASDEDDMGVKDSDLDLDSDLDSDLNFSLPSNDEEIAEEDNGALEFSMAEDGAEEFSFDDNSDDAAPDFTETNDEILTEESSDLSFDEEEADISQEFSDLHFGGDEDEGADPTVVMTASKKMEEFKVGVTSGDDGLNNEDFDDPLFDKEGLAASFDSPDTGSLEGTLRSIIEPGTGEVENESTGEYSLPEGTDLNSSEEFGLTEMSAENNLESMIEEDVSIDSSFVADEFEDDFSESTDPTRVYVAGDKSESEIENALLSEREEAPSRVSRVVNTKTNYNEEESIRGQGLLKAMREEREALLKQVNELKTNIKILESENLGLKAEREELKIEVAIIKKRSSNDTEELTQRLKISEDKNEILKEKVKTLQNELERSTQRGRINHNQIKQREKELEGQLELIKIDSQGQVESRDKKIIELKRKIDSLEFNMENAVIREQKTREDKVKLEDRLSRMMKTLRGSIQVLENDLLEDDIAIDDSSSVKKDSGTKK